MLVNVAHAANGNDPWADVIARVSKSVVSLQVSQLRDFGHATQGLGGATGFVVDAEQGIILTNRHVIGAGPIRATATFQNKERIDLVPLYRDPIHDFGFLRYNPADLKYLQPNSLPLRPEKVSVGMNIRVIGSDGGEQLSILAGTLARLDRKAPNYGRYEYNDFNTFYLQAASSTSGGSSGSPVLDADGDVVALNAAANSRTAASFFLPLARVQRALTLLQQDQTITRGSLQTVFEHHSFRYLQTLGLDAQTEARLRGEDPNVTGLLTVAQVLPGGVADGQLHEGDILLALQGKPITHFIALESVLDAQVGKSVTLTVRRQGQDQQLTLPVADLHALMPNRFLQMGDTILQDMSIQHVRGMNIPRRGVVLVKPGYQFSEAGVPHQAVITEINGKPIHHLGDVQALLKDASAEPRWRVRYLQRNREFFPELAQVDITTAWFRFQHCDRQDGSRFWDCQTFDPSMADANGRAITPTLPTFRDPLLQQLAPAMVKVDFNIPYGVDNVFARHFSGTGLVVDADNGLIVIDRNTVPISMGEARVTFFGAVETSATVAFLHPDHNLALLRFDPSALGDVTVPRVKFANPDTPLPNDLFRLVYRQDGTYQFNRLANLSRVSIALERPRLPRFQQLPLDAYSAANLPPSLGGPVVDADGVIHALWTSFAVQDGKDITEAEWAIPIQLVAETLNNYRENAGYYTLDARLYYKSLSEAIELGLGDDWLQRFAALDAANRRVLYVEQIVPGSAAQGILRAGDILLSINGEIVSELQAAQALSQHPTLTLEILRAGEVLSLECLPTLLDGVGTRRAVSWAGALFQNPHREIALYTGIREPGVYIAHTEPGSPAVWDRLYRNRLVTAVNGEPIHNLDEFLARVRHIPQDEYARLTTVSMSGRRDIISVAPEYYFWPTFEIDWTPQGWRRTDYSPSPSTLARGSAHNH